MTLRYLSQRLGMESCQRSPRLRSPHRRAFCFVLQKITACVMVSVSYRSQSVSNFHCSFSTATKNCLMPAAQERSQEKL